MPGCRLIVHADDFGQTRSINEGVLLAHKKGILTSASLMPTGAAFEHAVRLSQETPSLDLGIHLTLVEEASLLDQSAIPSLLNEQGRLHDHHTAFVQRYLQGKVNLREVHRELEAQIRAVLRHGLSISHFDSHQHLHMLPKIRAVVLALAQRYNVGAVRFPREKIKPYMLRAGQPLRLIQLMALNVVCGARSEKALRATDHFVGFFFGGKLNVATLTTVLRHLPPSGTCELMCHPGVDARDASGNHTGYNRSDELDALLSPAIAARIRGAKIELSTFRDRPFP